MVDQLPQNFIQHNLFEFMAYNLLIMIDSTADSNFQNIFIFKFKLGFPETTIDWNLNFE